LIPPLYKRTQSESRPWSLFKLRPMHILPSTLRRLINHRSVPFELSRLLSSHLIMFTIPGPSSPPRQPPSKRPTPSPLDAPVKSLFVPQKKKRKQKHSLPEPFSPADVVWNDVRNFLSPEYVRERLEKGDEWDAPAGLVMREEVVLRVGRFTVSGEWSTI